MPFRSSDLKKAALTVVPAPRDLQEHAPALRSNRRHVDRPSCLRAGLQRSSVFSGLLQALSRLADAAATSAEFQRASPTFPRSSSTLPPLATATGSTVLQWSPFCGYCSFIFLFVGYFVIKLHFRSLFFIYYILVLPLFKTHLILN